MNAMGDNKVLGRTILIEVKRLCDICVTLFDLLTQVYTSMNMFNKEKVKEKSNPQCVCLQSERKGEHYCQCMICKVGYHPECIGLLSTSYDNLLQTKHYGYWSLDRGFICPNCCKVSIFEQSHVMKGIIQIQESLSITWQSYLKKHGK
jgi:hypothetical protein